MSVLTNGLTVRISSRLRLGIGCVLWGWLGLAVGHGQESADPWPEDAYHRMAGPFRAWSSIPNDPKIDLSRLEGLSDIEQVYVHGGGWVVLRKNGQTVSTDGQADREGIQEICHGWDQTFGLITREGKALGFGKSGEFEVKIPENWGTVVDVYLSPHQRIALAEDGRLRIWGKAYDGIKEESNPEWGKKFAVPAGRKVVAMSCSDHALVFKLDSGDLTIARSDGLRVLHEDWMAGQIDDFAVSRSRFFGIRKDDRRPYFQGVGASEKPLRNFPNLGNYAAIAFEEGNAAIFAINEHGRIFSSGAFLAHKPELKAAMKKVEGAKPGQISIFTSYGEDPVSRLFWFDERALSDSKITSVIPSKAPSEPPATEAMRPEPTETPIQAPPAEVNELIGQISGERQEQYAVLLDKYSRALTSAGESAAASGNSAVVKDVQWELGNTEEFVAKIREEKEGTGLRPLPKLPAFGLETPDSIEKLRRIFETEAHKIEAGYFESLDRGLKGIEEEKREARETEDAQIVNLLHQEMVTAFHAVKEGLNPSSPSPSPSGQGTLDPLASVSLEMVPGRLNSWSFVEGKKAANLSNARGIGDFVQVHTWGTGWVALRQNGETVTSNGKNQRRNILRITQGWGECYGLIDQDRKLQVIGEKAPTPPQRPVDVIDAFISEGHCLALLEDGTVKTWGPNYRAGGETWPDPPESSLAGVQAIAGSPEMGVVLGKNGTATIWCATGKAKVPDRVRNRVLSVSCSRYFVNLIQDDGSHPYWHVQGVNSGTRENVLDPSSAVAMESMHGDVLYQLKDGSHRIGFTGQPELLQKLAEIGRIHPDAISAFRVPRSKDNHLIWIE